MAQTASGPSFVLTDGSVDPFAGNGARVARAAAPVLIGLMAPMLLMLAIEPGLVRHAHFLVTALLIPILLIAVGIYIYCVVSPGDVNGVVVDTATRQISIVQSNMFATRSTQMPFAAITSVRTIAGYDRDGYATRQTELVTRRAERIPLPAGTTDAEVTALKQVLGL
jgi:hypothetical protein